VSNFLIPNVGAIQPQKEIRGEAALPKGADGGVFEKSLREKLPASAGEGAASPAAPLKFSSHAMHRIKDRSIALGQELMGKLEKAVDTAAQKGSKESLILSDNAAFIVSVRNKTVITVLDRNQMNGNVFTNLDSTVVI